MYAIVKTGGKQYKVAPGDKLVIEKVDAEPGSTIELQAICIVDGDKVEADPAKAAATKVVASVLEQFKGDKQLVFKFKKRKNYKKLRGHRQLQTRVRIESVGSEKAPAPVKAAKKADDKKAADAAEKPAAKTTKKAAAPKAEKAAAEKPAAKKADTAKKTTAKAADKDGEKAPAKKTATKKADKDAAEKSAE